MSTQTTAGAAPSAIDAARRIRVVASPLGELTLVAAGDAPDGNGPLL